MCRAGILIATMLLSYSACPTMAWEEKPSTQGNIPFQTIHTDGKQILLAKTVPIPGKTKTTIYTVRVPVKTSNGIRYVDEKRAREEQATKEERVPAGREYSFTTVDGKKIDREKLISEIPPFGMLVITVYDKEPLPKEWVQLLRSSALVMRFNPPAFDEEE